MNEISGIAEADPTAGPVRSSRAALLWLILPMAALGLAIVWLLATNPLQVFGNGAPPVETLTFERTIRSALRTRIRSMGVTGRPMSRSVVIAERRR